MTHEYRGGCLCGAVEYVIAGEPRFFFHCHCRRCRKASGTGHASNIIMKPDSAAFIRGEALLNDYKVPDAKRFRTVFCTECGSPQPRIAPDLSVAVIPAGSLDTDPPIEPTGRIMWDSRTEWSCSTAELPTWSRYPD